MNNLTLLTYTHSKCVDLHPAYFGRIEKYFPSLKNKYVTCNEFVPYGECVVYDNEDTHSNQMVNVLSKIPTDYTIYSQEDYVLFDYVKEDVIKQYIDLMETDKSIGFIRLIRSGVGDMDTEYNTDLLYVDSNSEYFFSTQATIWRREVLLEMFKNSEVDSIFNETHNSKFLKDLNVVGLYEAHRGNKVGNHYNSTSYPYIATAKVRGYWNMFEYPTQVYELMQEYNLK
jgi:hypothetical protein